VTSHAISMLLAAWPRRGHSLRASATLLAMLVGIPAYAASYTWDNGVGTADYIGTGQWTNNTNWDPTSPSGGPVAGDDLTFDLYLNNPRVPRTSGTVSGTATDVAWIRQIGGAGVSQTFNSMTFTGSSPKYVWAINPTISGSSINNAQFLQPAGGITIAADSGPVFIGNANANAPAALTFRLPSNQAFVNNSPSALTFGTRLGTVFDSTTLVGSNTTTGIAINGFTSGTIPTVLTMNAASSGDIVMNGNFSNGTSGLQLVVNNGGSGKVISYGNFAFNSGNLLNLANPSGVRILSGSLVVAGTFNGSTTFTVNNNTEIATGGNLTITRSGAMPFSTPATSGGGTLVYDGGSGSLLTVSGSLGHTGGTTVSSGTLQLASGATLGAGNIAVAGGARLDFNQPTPANVVYSGTISGAGQLTKFGSGTFALTGNNAFTGGITAGDGVLSMAQLDVSRLITGTSPGTLAVAGNGTLDVSTANNAGGLVFRLGTASDLVTVTGNLQIGSGTLNFDDFTFTPGSGFGPGSYTLFSPAALLGSLGGSTSGTVGGLPASLQVSGNSILLSVVPEPSLTAALVAGLGMGVLVLRRRQS
jgi:fibronectin-binding autotransporter adhesin